MKEKEVIGTKTMLSGIQTVTNWSWDQLMDGFALASFQVIDESKHFIVKDIYVNHFYEVR